VTDLSKQLTISLVCAVPLGAKSWLKVSFWCQKDAFKVQFFGKIGTKLLVIKDIFRSDPYEIKYWPFT
jgi:hypothetical protein